MDREHGRAPQERFDPASLVLATRLAVERAARLLAQIERTDAELERALHAARRAVAASRLARAARSNRSPAAAAPNRPRPASPAGGSHGGPNRHV
jgi:hypothetical protein